MKKWLDKPFEHQFKNNCSILLENKERLFQNKKKPNMTASISAHEGVKGLDLISYLNQLENLIKSINQLFSDIKQQNSLEHDLWRETNELSLMTTRAFCPGAHPQTDNRGSISKYFIIVYWVEMEIRGQGFWSSWKFQSRILERRKLYRKELHKSENRFL